MKINPFQSEQKCWACFSLILSFSKGRGFVRQIYMWGDRRQLEYIRNAQQRTFWFEYEDKYIKRNPASQGQS